jgi:CubicO group peptidase (beta-lactamase class C family)
MYTASGYVIESVSGQTWEDFVRERIFKPLEMNATVFTVQEMKKNPDHAVPYQEKRDSTDLMQIPYYEDTAGMAPCGAIISSIEDMSRWLGLDQTPWSERRLESRTRGKKADQDARSKVGSDRVAQTRPSHPLSDFVSEYEHPAYGILKIGLKDDQVQFDFHNIRLPLSHYHYDRFDTPDDELWGKWSVSFSTSPQGDVSTAVMSLDEAAVTFTRKVDAGLLDPRE